MTNTQEILLDVLLKNAFSNWKVHLPVVLSHRHFQDSALQPAEDPHFWSELKLKQYLNQIRFLSNTVKTWKARSTTSVPLDKTLQAYHEKHLLSSEWRLQKVKLYQCANLVTRLNIFLLVTQVLSLSIRIESSF